MRQSELFTRTRREAPSDETSKNAQLLIRGGFIHKEIAGAYVLLPLGLRVYNKIVSIIREEMNAAGGQEILMSALQGDEVWKKSGRWSDEIVDSWFKTQLKNGTTLGLGFTHEEPLTNLMREHVHSYRDLPRYVYQFQTKFRNELRARSGIIRGREFVMKDLYSFSKNAAEHEAFYERMKEAYLAIFRRVGLGEHTFTTFASGGSFSKYSHEFQTVCDAGEDTIYVDEGSRIAVNKEVLSDEVLDDLGLSREDLQEKRAVEVGNIFSLGTRFSEALSLTFKDEGGADQFVVMGSYGIGPQRLMGVVTEVLSDGKGMRWPEALAPFRFHLIDLSGGEGETREFAEAIYATLTHAGAEVLFDDRPVRAGEKFADADLLGIPLRVVVSDKTIIDKRVEVTKRLDGTTEFVSPEDLATL